MKTAWHLINGCWGQVASTPAPFPQPPLPLAKCLQSQLAATVLKLFVSPEGSTPNSMMMLITFGVLKELGR
jgi:hypothetical protein